jgi:hypothetical protein
VTDTAVTSGPANNSSTRETNAAFTFTGSDDETPLARLSFECSLDTINFVPCSSPQTYTNLTSMGHLFRVRSKDEQGNVDATPASVLWYVDLIAPDTQIQGGPAGRETRTTAGNVDESPAARTWTIGR